MVQIEVAAAWAKAFYHAAEIVVPDTPKPLGENRWIQVLHSWPLFIKIGEPLFGGFLVVPAQFLYLEDVKTEPIQQLQCSRKTGNAAAREDVSDRQELGGKLLHVARRRD